MNKLPFLILLSCLPGCMVAEEEEFTTLRPGLWIEAKGKLVEGKPLVDEIDELMAGDSDKREKLDIDAQADSATATELGILGMKLEIDAETEFENANKDLVDPYIPDPGDWLTVKLRWKDEEEAFKLRTIRKGEARPQFKVEGEVVKYDPLDELLDVGGIQMRVTPDADIKLLGQRDASDPLALFQADDQKAIPFSLRIGENLILGGQVGFGFGMEDEYDLDETTQRDRILTDVEAKIAGIYLFGTGNYFLFDGTASRADRIRRDQPDQYREQLQIARGFTSLTIADGIQFLAGRQDWDEEREWLYDEVLDGARLLFSSGAWRFEISGAMGPDWATPFSLVEDSKFYTAYGRYNINEDWVLGAYVLKRTDSSARDHEPLLYGIRSINDDRKGLGHWAELSFAKGHTGNIVNGPAPREDINGYAFDIGALYAIDSGWRPTFGLGYAFGSGRRDSANNLGYRQTGFQDNNGKMGGVTSVRYYGELLRPELANLAIFTASAAVRPWRNASLSVLFHHYVQDFAAEHGPILDIRDSSGSRPNGRIPELGYEVDVVFGLRMARRLTLEVIGAHFVPGSAFDNSDPASALDVSFRLSF